MIEKVRLGDICDVRDGTHDSPKYHDSGYPLVTSKNLSKGFVDFTDCNLISKEDYDKINIRSKVDVGDILMPMIGTVGNPVIVQIEPEFAIKNVALIKFYKDSRVLNKYIKVLLESNYFDRTVLSKIRGGTQKFISLNDIRRLEIILPPISEQLEIVDRIEKVNVLIDTRKEQLEKLDELVKARFVELFDDPQINPNGYALVKLSDVATYFNGLTYKPENVAETGTIVLRSSNIQNSQLDFVDTVRVDCTVKEKLMVQENDILMCSRNGSARLVGKVALVKGIKEPMTFGAFMMIIRSRYYSYLMTYFQMDAFRQQIKTGATTTINQITGRMLDEVIIPLPPMELVEQFTTFVEQTDKSKLEVQNSLEKLELLKKTLMQKYFG